LSEDVIAHRLVQSGCQRRGLPQLLGLLEQVRVGVDHTQGLFVKSQTLHG
jgi:hypothetical protein